MNSQIPSTGSGWTPAAHPSPRSPADHDARWTRVSANVFVSAVLSGARGPLFGSTRPSRPGAPAPRSPWWRKFFPARKPA